MYFFEKKSTRVKKSGSFPSMSKLFERYCTDEVKHSKRDSVKDSADSLMGILNWTPVRRTHYSRGADCAAWE